MSRKEKLVIVSIILACLVIAVALLGAVFYKTYLAPLFDTHTREAPLALREPKTLVGADFLTKSQFYRTTQTKSWLDLLDADKIQSRLDLIKHVRVGQLDGQPGLDVGLAGMFGMSILDLEGQVKERVEYQFEREEVRDGASKRKRVRDSFHEMRLVDVEGDGVCETLGYDGLDGIALFDHLGRVQFNRGQFRGEEPAIKEVAAGDIDGDGKLEFVAAWGYEPSGIELMDRFGRSLWRREEKFKPHHLEMADVDGDGRAEIVEANMSELEIRDAQGKLTKTVNLPGVLSYLSLCPRPDAQGAPQNLLLDEGRLILTDLDGKNVSNFEAPLSKVKLDKPHEVKYPGMDVAFVSDAEEAYRAEGMWVQLRKDQPKYLAVVARFPLIDRSVFYIYDAQGKLLYHEILPEDSSSIAALPSERGEDILVGGQQTIWRYQAAH